MANRLKITSLKFISAVDAGAQGPISNVALVKRAPAGDEYTITCKVAKLDEAIGVVFGYALASTLDGGKTPHVDLQGDAIVGGDELIKIALAFAEGGALTDVMHDENPDGWVPFMLPINKETKEALQLTSDIEGIAIGMKPSAETFKRFQSGELAAFSIGGTGIREPLTETKRAPVAKQKCSLVTDIVDGHQHQIAIYENGEMWVQSATSEGAEQSHSHGLVRGADGSLTILLDSGHTHQLAEGQPGLVVVAPDAIVIVQASAPKSTPSTPALSVSLTSKEFTMTTEHEKTIADLTKRNERLDRIVKLAPDARGYFDSLKGDEAEEFLSKSAAERSNIVKAAEAADEVVEYDGQTIRKSKNPDLFVFAKAAKAREEKQAADIAKQAELIEKADITKRTTETLGQLTGADPVREYIFRSVIKGGGSADMVADAIKAMKGWAAETRIGKAAPGAGGEDVPADGPQGELDALVAKHMADHKVEAGAARLAVVKSGRGRELYNQIELQKKQRIHA